MGDALYEFMPERSNDTMKKKFSAQYHINRALFALYNASDAPATDLLDKLDEVEEAACDDCTSRADCMYRDCEHCRFKAELNRIVNLVLDKDEAAAK